YCSASMKAPSCRAWLLTAPCFGIRCVHVARTHHTRRLQAQTIQYLLSRETTRGIALAYLRSGESALEDNYAGPVNRTHLRRVRGVGVEFRAVACGGGRIIGEG